MLSLANSGNPIRYPIIAKRRFATIPEEEISPR